MSKPNSNPKTTGVPEADIAADGTVSDAAANAPTERVLRGLDGVVLRALTFRDEQDADGYHNETLITNGRVATREMADAVFEAFTKRLTQVQQVLKAPIEAEAKAKAMEATRDFAGAVSLREKAQRDYERAQLDNALAARDLASSHVAGWDFDRQYTKEGFSQLRGDDQRAVINDIIQNSIAGRESESFLADDLSGF